MTEINEIKVKFIDCDEYLDFNVKGDWIDLRARENAVYRKGDLVKVPLGVAMELPDGYEAHVAARSSTCKSYGLIPANGFGIIDNSYCGDDDEWCFLGYAIKSGIICKGERVCQFRIVKNMPVVDFNVVTSLNNKSRGGFGSTGNT